MLIHLFSMKRLFLILGLASAMSTLSAQQAEIIENGEKTQYENTSYLVVLVPWC